MDMLALIVGIVSAVAALVQIGLQLLAMRRAKSATAGPDGPTDTPPTTTPPTGGPAGAGARLHRRIQRDGTAVLFRIYKGGKDDTQALIRAITNAVAVVVAAGKAIITGEVVKNRKALVKPLLAALSLTALGATDALANVPLDQGAGGAGTTTTFGVCGVDVGGVMLAIRGKDAGGNAVENAVVLADLAAETLIVRNTLWTFVGQMGDDNIVR